jgi:hypothetical protein
MKRIGLFAKIGEDLVEIIYQVLVLQCTILCYIRVRGPHLSFLTLL